MYFRTTAIALGLLSALAAAYAQETNVAVVNGVAIPQARLDYVVKIQATQGKKDDADLRKQIKEALINREILSQEASKRGLDNTPELAAQVEMARQEFLIRALFDEFAGKNAPTDEEVTAEYEKAKQMASGGGLRKEYLARHILIKNEKTAKATLASLNKAKGKNFEQLAKTKSEDGGSKKQGGLLEWNDGSGFVKEFSEAMTQLKKGEYTQTLVKSHFGYHIIRLEDERPIPFPVLDEVKDKVQQQVMIQKRDKFIAELKAAAKVE
ncbi:MAG: peptidylprolyl isomerase [Burkholderiales bacterium]